MTRNILTALWLLAALLSPLAAAPPGGYTIYAVPHSHLDIEWFWTYDRTQSMAITNLRRALTLLRQDPRYAFLQDMRAALEPFWESLSAPDRAFLVRMVREGRFEVATGMYVQPDVNEPDFESLARQFLFARPWLESTFGASITTCWNVDSFGQPPQMPQLARRGGLRYFVFARDVPPSLKDSVRNPFYWRSPDGSRVLAYWLPGNYDALPGNAARILERTLRQNLDANDKLLIPWGGDVYFPTHDSHAIQTHLREAARQVGIPIKAVIVTTARRYFEDVERSRLPLPIYDYDFNPPLLNQDLRGVWGERPRQKLAARQAEETLESAEKFASLASAFGDSYPAAELRWGWQRLLFNQNHDSRGGSHTDAVAEAAMSRYGGAIEAGRGALDRALFRLSRRIDTSAGGKYPFLVFNSLSDARSELVRHEVLFWREFRNFQILDPAGASVPYRVLSLTHRMAVIEFVARDMPPFGYRVYRVAPIAGELHAPTWHHAPDQLATRRFRVTLDKARGTLSSLVDLSNAAEILDTRRYGGNELVLEEEKDPDLEGTLHFTGRELAGSLFQAESIEESRDDLGVRLRVGGAFLGARLTREIALYDALPRIDFRTDLEGFPGRDGLLEAVFPLRASGAGRNLYETHGAVTARPDGIYNANTWAGIETPSGGLAILNRGTAGHRIENGVLRLILLRSITNYSGYHSPDAAERGSHRFEYSLYPYAGTWRAGVACQAHSFNTPLRVVATDSHSGPLPAEHAFFSVASGAFEITALKQAEAGAGFILRGYERNGSPAKVLVRSRLPLARAWRTDLLEKPGAELRIADGSLLFEAQPFEYVTLKLELAPRH